MTLTDTQVFLKELFDSKPDDHWILLWELNGHKSVWFKEHQLAADYVSMSPDDIYFGVGISAKDFGPTKRCPQKAISGIPGFYVDIDIENKSAHKGKKYPKTMDEALSLVNGHGFDPTIIVNSGYGIHCYWLFNEMWMFENEPEWFRAKMLSRRMNETIKKRALDLGYDIDSVFDLSRVLRPPGSFNCKKKKKLPVTIHSHNSKNRYLPALFDEILEKQPIPSTFETNPDPEQLQQEILSPSPPEKKTSKGIILDLNADPNAEKMMEMATIFENFTITWNYDRADLPSPSEYDLSLANFGAKIGMSDQQIANMIIAFRRRHKLDLKKCTRLSYMTETIMKAKKKAGSDEALRDMERLTLIKGTQYEDPSDHQKRIDSINKKVHPMRLIEFIKEIYGPNPTDIKYKLILDIPHQGVYNRITVRGNHDFIDSPAKFRKTVQNAPGVNKRITIPHKEWDKFSQTLSDIVVEIEIGDVSPHEKMESWIEEYIPNYSKKNTFMDCIDSREPFFESGHWHLFFRQFKNFIYHKDSSVIDDEVRSYMKEEGFISIRKRARTSSGRASRKVWQIPNNLYQI
jgi:hypothetical protein